MNLKTYRGNSMAEALAEVKKDLGKDAVILHTRAFRVGAVMGVGGRQVVEITASNEPAPAARPRPARSNGQTAAAPAAEFVTETFRRVDRVEQLAEPPIVQTRPLRADRNREEPPRAAEPARSEPPRSEPPRSDLARPEPARPQPVRPEPARPVSAATDIAEFAPRPADVVSRPQPPASKPASLATRVEPRPVDSAAVDTLRSELTAIKGLVGQVLRATRHTAFAVTPPSAGPLAASVLTHGGLPEPLFDCFLKLQESQVSVDLVEGLIGKVRDELAGDELADGDIVRATVLRQIAATIPVRGGSPKAGRQTDGRPLTIALLGPTGVGKTTTIAKIAAMYKLRQGRRVGLVTSDTYRIAAVEQLRTYANIIGLPLKVAMTPGDMSAAVESLADCDVILVDTAGRSQHDAARIDELAAAVDAAAPHERFLVLSSTSAESVLHKTAQRFAALSPTGLILTKLDEAVQFGVVPNMLRATGLTLAMVTTGQEVPDDIEVASADRLARLVLDGSEAAS